MKQTTKRKLFDVFHLTRGRLLGGFTHRESHKHRLRPNQGYGITG